MTIIAEAPTPTKIVFGTDGWRAKVADDYTFDAVRVCAQSVAEWVVKNGGADRGVVIGFDRRFASEHFAAAAAEVVAAHDVNVHLATAAAPTQSFSWATMRRKAKAGIVITASHNPWTDNGFKVKAPTGSAGGPDMLKVIEQAIAASRTVRISAPAAAPLGALTLNPLSVHGLCEAVITIPAAAPRSTTSYELIWVGTAWAA